MRILPQIALTLCVGPILLQAMDPVRHELTVGKGWGLVRQVYTVSFREGVQEILLDRIPAEADLSSLVVSTRRDGIQLLNWHRQQEGAPVSSDPSLIRDPEKDAVIWRPSLRQDTPAGKAPGSNSSGLPGPVACTIQTDFSGTRETTVQFLLPGMDWKSMYRATIRETPGNRNDTVSMDLQVQVEVVNPSNLEFDNASLLLIGGGSLSESEELKDEPGFLAFDDDSAISDQWLPRHEKVTEPMFRYRTRKAATIPAGGSYVVSFLEADRKPGRRLYLVSDRDVPEGEETPRPLRTFVLLKNIVQSGLGAALPPGEVNVYAGGLQNRFLKKGVLPRTPIDDDIQLDLGLDNQVRGVKRLLERVPGLKGFHEEGYEITIQNDRAEGIAVEAQHQPPGGLDWKLLRSNVKAIQAETGVRFLTSVAPGSSAQITYRLRIQQPETPKVGPDFSGQPPR